MFMFSGPLLTGSSIISKSEDLLESYEILNNFIRDISNLFVNNVQLIQKCDFFTFTGEKNLWVDLKSKVDLLSPSAMT